MLEFRNVSRLFNSNKGLKDCSWIVNENEIVGVLGNNGCGKTTSFKILLGLETYEGSIFFEGKQIKELPQYLLGYVPEERTLCQDCYINDLLIMIGRLKGISKRKIHNVIDEYLSLFELISYKYKRVGELSKGNQQILQIICGIFHNPKILILDEPFNGLDKSKIQKVIKYLKNRQGITLISFHQYELVHKVCDKIIYLDNGEVSEILEVPHD